ncbi:MAG: hypothetical protein PHD95_04310 [Candidatus ainarchaeum sp.]|nr:hypothetical protein [Candidatus ainarchaeum sp.]
MNSKIIFSAIIFLFLLAAANASAVTGNFSVSVDCLSPAQAVFSLNNDSAQGQTFRISSVGENKDWINLNGKWVGKEALEITLASGEAKNLYAFIKPQSCYTQPGNYEITLQFAGASESFSQIISVTVRPSRSVSIDVNAASFELRQCEQKNFTATIANTGRSDELVSFFIKGLPDQWLDYSKDAFLLEKNHSKQVLVKLKPACSAQAKEYPFSVQATIQSINFVAQKSLALKIADAQQTIISANPLKSCKDKETTAQIKIKNSGRLADSLELSVSGLPWASISQAALDLNSGEEKTIDVSFKKTDSTAKEYPFVIVAHSKLFGKDTEQEFSVQLQDCYGVAISSVKANGQETAVPEACIEEQLVYEFELFNSKAEPIDVSLSLTGITAQATPATATIQPGQKQVFKATISLANETAGDKNFELAISSNYFSTKEKFSFRAIACYALLVDYDGLNNSIDVNASDSKGNKANPFTVKIKNTGTKKTTVNADVAGENWVYFQPGSFGLEAGQEKEIYLYFDPPYDTKNSPYNAKLSISAQHFSESKEIIANVYGGLYGAIGKADVSASGELGNVTQAVEKTVEIGISIKNDSNSIVKITDLNAFGYNAKFDFSEKSLAPEEELQAKMTLFLGKDFNETQFTVPIRIFTDKGEIVRDIQIDLNAQKKQQVPIFGWIPTASVKDLAMVVLIAIVIVLAIVIILKSRGTFSKEEDKEEKIESYWKAPEEESTGAKAKSLEEITKKIKSRPKKKAKKRK